MDNLNFICNKVAALRLFHPTVFSILFEPGYYHCDTAFHGESGRVRGVGAVVSDIL